MGQLFDLFKLFADNDMAYFSVESRNKPIINKHKAYIPIADKISYSFQYDEAHMLGISFEGRYNRKQFWIMTLSISLIMILITMPFTVIIEKTKYHLVETMIAKQIIARQGTIKHQDIDRMKDNVENDSNIDLKTKGSLEKSLDEMEQMSDAQLTELAMQEFSRNEMVLAGIYLITILFLSCLSFTFYVKRGHDLNFSGWVTCIALFLPLINLFYVIYLGFFKGNPNVNQYGPAR